MRHRRKAARLIVPATVHILPDILALHTGFGSAAGCHVGIIAAKTFVNIVTRSFVTRARWGIRRNERCIPGYPTHGG